MIHVTDPWLIGGDDPEDRLMRQVARESWRFPDIPTPSREQVAMVLAGLADHTANWDMVTFTGEDPATNIGRWMHSLSDLIGDRVRRVESSEVRLCP